MYWALGGVAAAALAWWLWRRFRKPAGDGEMISFVGLLDAPRELTEQQLTAAACRAWDADLRPRPDPDAEPPDGFVVGGGMLSMIKYRDRMVMVHNHAQPYLDHAEANLEAIADRRLREAAERNRAWFSCDAMGNGASPAEEREWRRLLGKLFAELVDESCLAIYVPGADEAFPVNDETLAALRSDDPLAELRGGRSVPIIDCPPDHPLLAAAADRARGDWGRFEAAFAAKAGENFSVKAPIAGGGNVEHIWISVDAIEGGKVYGRLGNDPGDLGGLKLGSRVNVPVAELDDWIYADARGKMQGGYSLEALGKIMKDRESGATDDEDGSTGIEETSSRSRPQRHPLLRRLGWHPMWGGLWLAVMVRTSWVAGFTAGRITGLAFVGLFFALTLYDWFSGHRWLDLLYPDDAKPIESE